PTTGDTPLVTADNEGAVEEAVAHLRAHGHRDIAFLAGPLDTGPVGRRRQVWQAAAGSRAVLLRSDYSRAAADALIRRLAAADTVPHALIAATDEQAIGLLSGACAAGLPVPGRVAVIGLDGTPDSAHTAPSLTVTGQPLESMARQAVDLLFDRAAPSLASRAALVRRRSCGCEEG
ncbi:substrate-binding domain-containing protein, partial [Nonomuraea sp. K274]